MKVFYAVSAFLKNENKYLLMKRADDRRYYPGFWSCIGGGIKNNELCEPEHAALRELFEETGIPADKINNLKLRYIHVAPRSGYITVHYIFFGETTENELVPCDEGETFWIPKHEVLDKGFTAAMRLVIEHYFAEAADNEAVYLYNENLGEIKPLCQ
jgi:8-oxo-dGTP pyrophosphatase MutT (NUDIX family)